MGEFPTGQDGLTFSASGLDNAATCLLLHGVGTTRWMWRKLVDDLSADFHVLVVDLPGHGASAFRPWVSLSDTAAAVAELVLRQAYHAQAHLVGLSLGGYVALEVAAARPDLVPSVTVTGVNVLPFPRPRLMRLAGRMMAPVMTSGTMLRANARALKVTPEEFDGYVDAARSMAPGTFLTVGDELMTYTVPTGAATSPTRVLALAGSQEQLLIRRSLSVISAAFPHGAARIAPNVGHAWNGQAPDLFAAAVRANITNTALPEGLLSASLSD